MTAYLDTSALAKLVSREVETDTLRHFLADTTVVTSAIARTELLRVGLRLGERQVATADAVLSGVAEVAVTRDRLDRAGRLPPAPMRSLDALHLVTALDLGADLDVLVAYDERLLDAARQHGLTTASPS
ncbi:MAG TPA: type II toxin-antitoxin system VapC family toxin [Actinomycetales bacterium]|nr:type II toxin-antitoxin system VapC family toxin [Actinomycetales bacterium]